MSRSESDVAGKILDHAEALVRTQGYNAFSFREVAKAVGVKSATVHYYHPTKADLGAAVARRYTDRFLKALGDPAAGPAEAVAPLRRLHALASDALTRDGMMCLCGMLGAEIAGLPPAVADEAAAFFRRTIDWTMAALAARPWGRGRPEAELRRVAVKTIATLEGGMIIARTMGDLSLFEDLAADNPATEAGAGP